MSPESLEKLLRDLPRIGTLVRDRGYRQIWRFEFEGRGYYLKYYPRRGSALKRLVRGSPALREFVRLQALQRAGINAPRAVAQLSGFQLRGDLGDAVILEAIEPAVQLDQYVTDLAMQGDPIPNRVELGDKIIGLCAVSAKPGSDTTISTWETCCFRMGKSFCSTDMRFDSAACVSKT